MRVTPIDHHDLALKRFTCTMTIQNMAIDYVTTFRFNDVMLFSEYVFRSIVKAYLYLLKNHHKHSLRISTTFLNQLTVLAFKVC